MDESIDKRLDEQDAKLGGIEKCLERLTTLLEVTTTAQQDHEQRLRAIESKGGEAWEKAVWLVLAAIIGAILTIAMQTVGLVTG